MGNRLHIAKKYQVEYASIEAFNWQIEELHNLLDALEVEYSGDTYDEDFEIATEDWQRGIEKLKHLETLSQDDQDTINDALQSLGYKRKEVIDLFRDYLQSADPNNYYLHFSFF